jgi:hypothetical protein
MTLLQVCRGRLQEDCKPVDSLIYELCKYKVTEVMDLKIDSSKKQFYQLATLCKAVEEKGKTVFGRK